MKKFFAFLLTFAMLFSLAMPAMAAEITGESNTDNPAVGDVSASYTPSSTVEPDTKTIYFDNTAGWETVYAYAWSSVPTTEYLGTWPGSTMTKVEGTESIYAIDVSSEAVNIIFNNGSGQTGDLTIPTDDKNLYTYSTNEWSIYGSTVEPVVEAMWGTSRDDLTDSGTLAEAFAAAADDSSIAYIQLQTSVTTDTGYDIDSGVFTLDLNGNIFTVRESFALAVRDSAVEITLTDTASGGEMISMQSNSAAVVVSDGQLVIDGGSYSGTYAVNVLSGSAEINGGTFTASYAFNVSNGAILTIHDGTIIGDSTSVVTSGTTTINGGTISAGSMGHIEYWGGPLDLSEYDDVNGLTLSQLTGADLTVSDENIKLPEGYVFKDSEGNTVTTLTNGTIYTIGAEGGAEPTAKITGVSITVDGTEYTEGNVAIYSDSTVTLNVTGTNLQYATADNYVGCYVYRWTVGTNNGFEITDDGTAATKAFIGSDFRGCNAAQINYRNADSSSVFSGITVNYNSGTKPVPTYNVTIDENIANGTVSIDKTTAAEGETVTVTVEAETGYAYVVNSLKVINDTTGLEVEVDEATKTFVMPDSSVTVTAEFEKLTVTSAEIVWGSMAFTYTDGENGAEGAWSVDSTAEDAGTVTVKNTGNTTFTAQASYESTTADYGTFTGTFDPASSELTAGNSYTFTLKLEGKPTKAIPAGTKIGEVTITINESAEG